MQAVISDIIDIDLFFLSDKKVVNSIRNKSLCCYISCFWSVVYSGFDFGHWRWNLYAHAYACTLIYIVLKATIKYN